MGTGDMEEPPPPPELIVANYPCTDEGQVAAFWDHAFPPEARCGHCHGPGGAIAGIGMIAVGVLGFPFIGALQERTASAELRASSPEVAEQILVEKPYLGVTYAAIDPERAREVTAPEAKEAVKAAETAGQFDALAKMALFPTFMLACYIGLGMYFKSRGGYTAVHLDADEDLTYPSHGEGGEIDREVTAEIEGAAGRVGTDVISSYSPARCSST